MESGEGLRMKIRGLFFAYKFGQASRIHVMGRILKYETMFDE
jgi:hypothetical protein